jgi:hypothetical protein
MRFSTHGVHGEISTLPGCTQVAVSHSVFSTERGLGNGKKANKVRQQFMVDHGYDYALCTVDAANEAQRCIMLANGWRHLDTFHSSKTNHTVLLYGKTLK